MISIPEDSGPEPVKRRKEARVETPVSAPVVAPDPPAASATPAPAAPAPRVEYLFFCTLKNQCKCQGFALHRGVAWGRVAHCNHEWLENHMEKCPGELIQLRAEQVEI